MGNAIITTHQKIEADRMAASEERIEQQAARWNELMGRPLTHAIRFTLDVDLPRDVAWLESCRDTRGEELLTILWTTQRELTPTDWSDLRDAREHVHRVLNRRRQFARTPYAYTLPRAGRLTEAEANDYMQRFGREVAPVCAS